MKSSYYWPNLMYPTRLPNQPDTLVGPSNLFYRFPSEIIKSSDFSLLSDPDDSEFKPGS